MGYLKGLEAPSTSQANGSSGFIIFTQALLAALSILKALRMPSTPDMVKAAGENAIAVAALCHSTAAHRTIYYLMSASSWKMQGR